MSDDMNRDPQQQREPLPHLGDVWPGREQETEPREEPEAGPESSEQINRFEGERDPDQEDLERLSALEEILRERELAVVEEERLLFGWKVPARPFKPRNREYYTTIGAIVILLSIILVFAREFLLVAVIMSLAFVSYVLASVEPEEVEHQVTTRGIRTGGRFFRWGALGRFWFHSKHGMRVLSVETGMAFPGELLMVVRNDDEEKIKGLLRRYLLNETPEPSFVDKASKWLQEKVPLENS